MRTLTLLCFLGALSLPALAEDDTGEEVEDTGEEEEEEEEEEEAEDTGPQDTGPWTTAADGAGEEGGCSVVTGATGVVGIWSGLLMLGLRRED